MAVTVTYQSHSTIKKITFDWETNAASEASTNTKAVSGQILGVICKPGDGVYAPTNAYDIYFKGPVDTTNFAVDHFAGFGANLSSTTTKVFNPEFHAGTYRNIALPISGIYHFSVKNAGSWNTGAVVMYYR